MLAAAPTPDQVDVIYSLAIESEVGKEGGYSNDPKDSGGETMFGITIARARAAGYFGPMSAMTRTQALGIYKLYYWQQPMFDKLALIDAAIATKLLGGGINCGQTTAGKWLQRSLNVLNQNASIFPDIEPDGVCGAMTRAAMTAFYNYRGENGRKVLLFMVTAQQAVNYINIAENRPKDEAFEWGWQLNRALG